MNVAHQMPLAPSADARLHGLLKRPDGGRMGYADLGDPAGNVVLYFHGWPSCRFQARIADDAARERGIRLVALERPGFGISDRQPGRTLKDWPEDVSAALEQLGIERFAIMGVSGGGPYTLATTWSMPERVVAAGVCCGAPEIASWKDMSELFPLFRMLWGARLSAPWLMPGLLHLAQHYVMDMPRYALLRYILGVAAPVERRAIRNPRAYRRMSEMVRETYRGHPQAIAEDGELLLAPWEFAVEEIRVPVRFWHGDLDQTLPVGKTRELAARIPGAEFVTFPEEAHYSLPLRHFDGMLDYFAERWQAEAATKAPPQPSAPTESVGA